MIRSARYELEHPKISFSIIIIADGKIDRRFIALVANTKL
jgi:hypothetical protein